MKDLTSGHPAQPNLDVLATQRTWSLRFWLLTALTGAGAGLAGGALMCLLEEVEHLAWDYEVGTLLEAASRDSAARHILVLFVAGLLVGFGGSAIRKFLGRPGDSEGSVWFRGGRMPTLSSSVQAIHSIVVVGMGTSLGRESPIKQAGGVIASRIAQWFSLSRSEQRLLVACGVGAGMASAYNVPVGGALFAVEVLLGSISMRLAMPALLCSGIATVTSWLLLPTGPVYEVPEYPLSWQLTVWSLPAGPLFGLAAVPLIRAIGWADSLKPRQGPGVFLAPAILLTLLGALSITFPQLLGNGKDAVQVAYVDGFGISLLLALPTLKLLATCACLGSGASGGLFTPTMTIGALLGGLLGHCFDRFYPGASMGSCAVIGSCAYLAAATHGPISALVLVLELTRHVDATMVPMLLAVAGALITVRRFEPRSLYSIRLHLRDKLPEPVAPAQPSPFERLISKDYQTMSAAAGFGQIAQHLYSSSFDQPIYVLDHDHQLIGAVEAGALDPDRLGAMPLEASKVADFARPIASLPSDLSEPEALARLASATERELPVVDSKTGRMIGVLAKRPSLPGSAR